MTNGKRLLIDHGERPDGDAFVRAWHRHRWVGQVADELGMSQNDCSYWSRILRSEGLDLPSKKFRPGNEPDTQDDLGVIEPEPLGEQPKAEIDVPRRALASEDNLLRSMFQALVEQCSDEQLRAAMLRMAKG